MSNFLDPPRITASALDHLTHIVSVVDEHSALVMRPPSGGVVLEVWAAHIPAGASVERAYASFTWMKPATTLPVTVRVGLVTGNDPNRASATRCHLFYKARWAREGAAVSLWSNVAVVEEGGSKSPTQHAGPGGDRRA